MRFAFKTAIVTGTSSGIGYAVAQLLLSEGATVYGLDIAAPKTVNGIKHIDCDVSKEEEIKAAIQEIRCQTDVVDFLVNVAGVLTVGPRCNISEQSLEQWEKVIHINLTSIMLMMKNIHPLLKNSSQPSIVNISSDQSFKCVKGSGPYLVSKVGINALTQLAALEFAQDHIRVNAVAPGSVRTNILRSLTDNEEIIRNMFESSNLQLPYGLIEPEDVADAVCYLIEAKRITGQIILMDSGKHL